MTIFTKHTVNYNPELNKQIEQSRALSECICVSIRESHVWFLLSASIGSFAFMSRVKVRRPTTDLDRRVHVAYETTIYRFVSLKVLISFDL